MRHRHGFDHTTGEGQKRLMRQAVGQTYEPPRRIDTARPGDHGADPLGDGQFRKVPSGDVVDLAERNRRLAARQ